MKYLSLTLLVKAPDKMPDAEVAAELEPVLHESLGAIGCRLEEFTIESGEEGECESSEEDE